MKLQARANIYKNMNVCVGLWYLIVFGLQRVSGLGIVSRPRIVSEPPIISGS